MYPSIVGVISMTDRQCVRKLRQDNDWRELGYIQSWLSLINGYQQSFRVPPPAAYVSYPFPRALRATTMSPTRATMALLE